MVCGSGASVHGLEWSRAGDTAVVDKHVDDDMAHHIALGYIAGGRGTSWGGPGGKQGCVWGLLGRRCSWWGCLGGFVEYTMRSEEHVRTTSRNGFSWAVDGLWVSFTASLTVSGASVVVSVLDMALDAVFEVAAA